MELEEAISKLNFLRGQMSKPPKHTTYETYFEYTQAIEIVLDALQNSIPKKKIKEFIEEELPDDEICAVCDIVDVNGVEIKQELQKLLESPNE